MIVEGLPDGAVLLRDWARGKDIQTPNPSHSLRAFSSVARGTDHTLARRANRDLIIDASNECDVEFVPDACMWNVYSGDSGVPFHHDERLPDIAILSLGADAEFALHPCVACYRVTDVPTYIVTVKDGDLLYLPPQVNNHYAHGVRSTGNRQSLVFRPPPANGPHCHESTHLPASRALGFPRKDV